MTELRGGIRLTVIKRLLDIYGGYAHRWIDNEANDTHLSMQNHINHRVAFGLALKLGTFGLSCAVSHAFVNTPYDKSSIPAIAPFIGDELTLSSQLELTPQITTAMFNASLDW